MHHKTFCCHQPQYDNNQTQVITSSHRSVRGKLLLISETSSDVISSKPSLNYNTSSVSQPPSIHLWTWYILLLLSHCTIIYWFSSLSPNKKWHLYPQCPGYNRCSKIFDLSWNEFPGMAYLQSSMEYSWNHLASQLPFLSKANLPLS